MRRLLLIVVTALLQVYGADQKAPKPKEIRIQNSSISREQEIQLGKQAAADVERQMEVVKNAEIEAWLNRIGAQLAKTPQANAYPLLSAGERGFDQRLRSPGWTDVRQHRIDQSGG